MGLQQTNRLLTLTTPLGADVLELTAFSGIEEMSRLFSYHLEMISDNGAIEPAKIVGKCVTFGVKLADGKPRYFNGVVRRFFADDEDRQGRRNYRAEVVPALWFLTRKSDCRIFQNQSVPDILKHVLTGIDSSFQLQGSFPPREYCVQYRETDFDFFSRLMEEEGFFYFFKHADGSHKLMLANQKSAYTDCGESEVDYPRDAATRAIADHITQWEHRYEFRTGKIAHTDYNFEDHPAREEPSPANLLMANQTTTVQLDNIQNYEFYDYPGVYDKKDHGTAYAKIRMEEEEAGYEAVYAASTCRTFTPAGKFKIKHHVAKSEEGKKFAITSIQHSATEPGAYETGESTGDEYSNTFTCIPDSVTFRPAGVTERPVVQGTQTAVVVGPPGEEIWPDKHGRVKVQFFWDRKGKRDDKSSCWIRCAQTMAGKGWGSIQIPRIGQEVVVTFLEGNPDRPLIIGVVYNGDQTPPYPLPTHKTQSGIKTNCSKGGGGSNEIRMEDKKGEEQVYIHAQKNQDTVVELNDTVIIGNNRVETVGKNESITIGGNRTETVNKDENITIGGSRTESVDKDESIAINGTRTEAVDKDKVITVGKSLTIAAGDQIVLMVGEASITMLKDGTIAITGKDISINGSGQITAKASKTMTLKGADHSAKLKGFAALSRAGAMSNRSRGIGHPERSEGSRLVASRPRSFASLRMTIRSRPVNDYGQ